MDNKPCPCGFGLPTTTTGPDTGTPICRSCAAREWRVVLADADRETMSRLRRRAEDRLRKSPEDLTRVIADLIAAGVIRYDE